LRAATWLLLLTVCGCRSQKAREFEADVASLARHIDSLRNAPNEGKGPLLEQLKAAPCEDPRVCELKSHCILAYMRHRSALEASARAAALIAAVDSDRSAAPAAALELKRAEEQLDEAKALTSRCASAQGELLRASHGER
jgi:outer membrane murein-binding lipoprotein Lpp